MERGVDIIGMGKRRSGRQRDRPTPSPVTCWKHVITLDPVVRRYDWR